MNIQKINRTLIGMLTTTPESADIIADRLEELERELAAASKLVAEMRAAAVGEIRGPSRGVVEDVAALRAEVQLLRMQAAAVMTASIQNTETSLKDRIGRDNPYWTQCYADVCAAVDREMGWRKQVTDRNDNPQMETLRANLQDMRASRDHWKECRDRAVDNWRNEVESLREDKDRLDWLDCHPTPESLHGTSDCRAIIDAARKTP